MALWSDLVATYVANLERLVSRPRLERFRPTNRNDLETAVTYLWNVALSEALMQGLAAVEVGLRNTVHSTMTDHVGTEYWFQSILKEAEMNEVHDKWTTLSKRHKKPPTPGKIIAELMFGFWPPLFSNHYHDLWWKNGAVLFKAAFPNIPAGLPPHPSIVLKDIYERVDACQKLRNRVMHHEPIFGGLVRLNRPILPLPDIHQYIVDLLTWIHSDLVLSLAVVDRFPPCV
jgi:hypothetical protein